jgi:molybdopterin converting factor small subunit
MLTIWFLSGLKEAVGRTEVRLDYRGTVSGLLEELGKSYGQRWRERVFAEDAPTRRNPFVKILVNGEDIRDEDPELAGDETLIFFMPVAGG